MNKIIKYCIIVVALITGAMAINIYNTKDYQISTQYTKENPQHHSSDFYINSFQIDVPDNCKNTEEFRIIHNLSIGLGRILVHDFSHSILQSSRLTHSKFNANRTIYLYFLSSNHQNGYYLYALRKLLI